MLNAAIAIALTVAVYWPVRETPFLYEDTQTLAAQPARLPTVADLAPGRYLTGLTIDADWRRGNGTPAAFHQTNLVLHLLNGGLVWLLARRIGLGDVAWIAGAVFLLHPIQTQAVSYISGRPDLLLTTFALVACLCLRRSMTVASVVGVLVAGWLALMTKQSAVALVGLLPLLAWCYGLRVRMLALAVCGLAAVALLGLPVAWAFNTASGVDPIRYAAAQLSAVRMYLGLTIWPHGFSIEHDVFAQPLLVHLLALEATILAVWLVWRARARYRLLAVSVGWVLCAIGPRLVVRSPDAITEAQFYLAFVGVSLACASALSRSVSVQECYA